MIEVIIHGRGGQGVLTASQLLALSAFEGGNEVQAFPSFGAERRGGPVHGYCRIDKKEISMRTPINKADFVLMFDEKMLKTIDIIKETIPGSTIIINGKKKHFFEERKTITYDLNSIGIKYLSKPIVNTLIIAAFAKISKSFEIQDLIKSLYKLFPKEIADKNSKMIKEAMKVL